MIPYLDMAYIEEDDRIRVIGKMVMEGKKTVGFITDSEPGKADRYIEKLRKWFPGIVVMFWGDGPLKDTVTVKVGPPTN